MKKNLLLIIAACAFFIPSVVFAKAPEYVEAEKSLYANALKQYQDQIALKDNSVS